MKNGQQIESSIMLQQLFVRVANTNVCVSVVALLVLCDVETNTSTDPPKQTKPHTQQNTTEHNTTQHNTPNAHEQIM